MKNVARLRCSEDTSWMIENDGLVLVQLGKDRVARLSYPEAALWDLLMRRPPWSRLVKMMAAISAMENQAAGQWIDQKTEQWLASGYLVMVKADG